MDDSQLLREESRHLIAASRELVEASRCTRRASEEAVGRARQLRERIAAAAREAAGRQDRRAVPFDINPVVVGAARV